MMPFNPELDLELTRLFKAPPASVWRCWEDPALLGQWWAPKPVQTVDVVIDLRNGGRFYSRMILPDGTEMPGEGCFLDVVPGHRIVFTDLMGAGFRPVETSFGFAAIITMAPEGTGTRYTARALHKTAEQSKVHADMGFHDGWGTAAAQLDALASGL